MRLAETRPRGWPGRKGDKGQGPGALPRLPPLSSLVLSQKVRSLGGRLGWAPRGQGKKRRSLQFEARLQTPGLTTPLPTITSPRVPSSPSGFVNQFTYPPLVSSRTAHVVHDLRLTTFRSSPLLSLRPSSQQGIRGAVLHAPPPSVQSPFLLNLGTLSCTTQPTYALLVLLHCFSIFDDVCPYPS